MGPRHRRADAQLLGDEGRYGAWAQGTAFEIRPPTANRLSQVDAVRAVDLCGRPARRLETPDGMDFGADFDGPPREDLHMATDYDASRKSEDEQRKKASRPAASPQASRTKKVWAVPIDSGPGPNLVPASTVA